MNLIEQLYLLLKLLVSTGCIFLEMHVQAKGAIMLVRNSVLLHAVLLLRQILVALDLLGLH
jgi:hypothetical protein